MTELQSQRIQTCSAAYDGNRKALAKEILEGKEKVECSLSEETVERHFTDLLGNPNNLSDQRAYPTPPPRGYAENTTLVGPTTVEEVKTALFKMKTKGAAGPDTIWVPALRKFDRAGTTLTMLFRAYQ